VWDCVNSKLVDKGILANDKLLEFIMQQKFTTEVFCEMIACYGMAVGKETFETCVWIGRCEQICADRNWAFSRIYRQPVKVHHCHSAKAKDPNVRQALLDRFGVVGTKKAPGPLFGVASHIWSALAIATYVADTTAHLTAASGLIETSTFPSGS